MILRLQTLALILLASTAVLAQPDYRVGVAVPEVVGPFQPLTTQEAFDTLMSELREKAPTAEFVAVDAKGVEFSDAAALGKSQGFDVLMWGTIRFKENSSDERIFSERPSKNTISAEVDIKVYSVEKEQFVLGNATWVTSDEWTTQSQEDVSDRQLAERCLGRAAKALVGAAKRRKETGWFQRH
jgi:hypothetical protein